MPTIKQYGAQKTSTQIISQPLARNTPSGGDAIVRGLADVGKEYERIQDDISSTEARDALNKFQKTEMDLLTNPETGYYGKNGINAYNGAQPTLKSLEQLKKELGGNLSNTARKKFEDAAAERISAANMNINRHAAKGYQTWKISGFDDEIANNLEEAAVNYTNPEAFAASMRKGQSAVYERASLAGTDPKEAVETFRGEFVKNAVLSAVNQSSAAAEKVMTDNIKLLQGEGATERLLLGKIAEKKKAEQTAYETNFALTRSKVLNDTYGDDREGMMAEIETISDPKLKEKTMKQATVEFNRRKTADKEAKGTIFDEATVAVNGEGGLENWVAQNSDKWERLDDIQKQKLQSGKMVETDWVTYNDLLGLDKVQLAKIDPNDYLLDFAESERRALRSAVNSAKEGKEGIGLTRSASNTSNLEIMFGKKKSSWNRNDRQEANQFYGLLQREEEHRKEIKGSELTSVEYTEMLNDLTNKVKVKSKVAAFLDSQVDITDFKDDNAAKYAKWLRSKYKKVNINNLLKARDDNVLGLK